MIWKGKLKEENYKVQTLPIDWKRAQGENLKREKKWRVVFAVLRDQRGEIESEGRRNRRWCQVRPELVQESSREIP